MLGGLSEGARHHSQHDSVDASQPGPDLSAGQLFPGGESGHGQPGAGAGPEPGAQHHHHTVPRH